MERAIQEALVTIIKQTLSELDFGGLSDKELYLDLTKDSRFGELTTNIALKLSTQLKKPARELATSIASSIEKNLKNTPLKDQIEAVKAENAGFINFYLGDNYFCTQLKSIIAQGRDFARSQAGAGKKVLIEFVSANPTGPLSVAHARQAAVGDVLANVLEYAGYKVKREYYLNDEGNQINILGQSVELRIKELGGEKIEFPEDHYQGEYIYDIAKKIQSSKLKIQNFADYAADYILEIIKKELEDFGVKFDCWFSQKELRKSGKIQKALDFLKKKGFIFEEDGALWFKSTQFGDDKDRVVVKSDGSYTYLAPDIAYHQDKFQRGFDWAINLWGPDHHGYINRLKAAVQALGQAPEAVAIIIVQLATIFREGKPIQMSTRRGQYITLREVLDEVGLDAARFFFLMRRTSSHLDFDLAVAKKQTAENPVYYVQYAHARICSILQNAPKGIDLKIADLTLLKEKEEIELMKKLWQFSFILEICLNTLDPYMLTIYLQELAEDFHKFYDAHRVLGVDAELSGARLRLIEATKIVIAKVLELLGVSRPESM